MKLWQDEQWVTTFKIKLTHWGEEQHIDYILEIHTLNGVQHSILYIKCYKCFDFWCEIKQLFQLIGLKEKDLKIKLD